LQVVRISKLAESFVYAEAATGDPFTVLRMTLYGYVVKQVPGPISAMMWTGLETTGVESRFVRFAAG